MEDESVKTQIEALLCDRNSQLIMITPSAAQKIPYFFVRFTRQYKMRVHRWQIVKRRSAGKKIPAVMPQAAEPRYTNHSVPYLLLVYKDAE